MFLSVFDMFKVGIGPSSSHTMGPMVAAARFLDKMRAAPFACHGVRGSLHGSLAFTGIGHATDRATILGLAGYMPDTYDHAAAEETMEQIRETHTLTPSGLPTLAFNPKEDLLFDFGPNLPGHANGMVLMATDSQGDTILQETYYSIGGGPKPSWQLGVIPMRATLSPTRSNPPPRCCKCARPPASLSPR